MDFNLDNFLSQILYVLSGFLFGIFASRYSVLSWRTIRDAHYGGAAKLGRGLTYQFPHDFPNHWTPQQYLPDELKDAHYYDYGPNKTEQAAKAYWARVKGKG